MKHIKKFNESYDEPVIRKLSYIEFERYRTGNGDTTSAILDYAPPGRAFLEIMEEQISEIEDFFDRRFEPSFIKKDYKVHMYYYDRLSSNSGRRGVPMNYGIKLSVDEFDDSWYFVNAYVGGKTYYFKCDDLDGLSELGNAVIHELMTQDTD